MQFAGIINPVSSLDGFGRWFGEIYPATHMVNISRGIFNKGLGFEFLQ
jgi:ribosome-dependent ATPase